MDQEILVSTPENVEFSHDLAGIGSRFIVSILHMDLQAAMVTGLAIILMCDGHEN